MEAQSQQWEIFLNEDNPADIRLTQEALKEPGINHQLEVARDGCSALVYLKLVFSDQTGKLPDLTLLDLNLPGMNGLEVLAAIKSNEKLKSIPVIIMSSSASDVDVCAAYKLNKIATPGNRSRSTSFTFPLPLENSQLNPINTWNHVNERTA